MLGPRDAGEALVYELQSNFAPLVSILGEFWRSLKTLKQQKRPLQEHERGVP